MEDSSSVCPGCGLRLPASGGMTNPAYAASAECLKLFHELSFYTLSHRDPFFIHQVAVDAYMAQHGPDDGKPIGITFALVGLYLLCEKGYTGREVQLAHIALAQTSKTWQRFTLPMPRGTMTVADVMAAAPGDERDAAMKKWAASVWDAWKEQQPQVEAIVALLK